MQRFLFYLTLLASPGLTPQGSPWAFADPCAGYAKIEPQLQSLSWEEMQSGFEKELERLERIQVRHSLEKRVLRDLQSQIRTFIALQSTESVLQQIKNSFCRSKDKKSSLILPRLAISGLHQSLLLPFRWMVLFGRELFAPQKNPFIQHQLPQQIGDELRESDDIVDLEIGPLYRHALAVIEGSSNAALLPILALPLYDFWMHRSCARAREIDPKMSRFCDRLRLLDQSFDRAALSGYQLAHKIRQRPYRRIDFGGPLDSHLCTENPRLQLRIAQQRQNLFLDALRERHPQIKDIHILPAKLDGCVSYQIELHPGTTQPAANHSALEGIRVSWNQDQPYESDLTKKGPELLCQDFHEYLIGGVKEAKTAEAFAMVRAMANPARTTPLSLQSITTENPVQFQGKLASRSVVLVPQPDPTLEAEAEKFQNEWKSDQKEFTDLLKRVRRIYHQFQSYSQCIGHVKATGFNVARFQQLSEKYEQLKGYKAISELALYRKQLKRFQKWMFVFQGSHLKWELQEGGSVTEILTALRDPTIAHLVIIGHGRGTHGKIVDPFHDVLPSDAFHSMSPQLRSLALFSCFSQSAISTYHLQKNMAQTPSYLSQRLLGSVGRVDGYENYAIANTLTYFMKRLDDRLHRADQSLTLTTPWLYTFNGESPDSSKTCKIILDKLRVTTGSFSVHVDQNVYAILRAGPKDRFEIDLPCDSIRIGSTLYLRGASALGLSTLDSRDTQIVLQDAHQRQAGQAMASPLGINQTGLKTQLNWKN